MKSKNKKRNWYQEDKLEIIDLLGKVSLKHGDTFRVVKDIPLDGCIENLSTGDLPKGSLISFERTSFNTICQPRTFKFMKKKFCLFRIADGNLRYFHIYESKYLSPEYLEGLDTRLIFEEVPILTNETIFGPGIYTDFSDFINQLSKIQKETLDKFKYEFLKVRISEDSDYCDRDDCCGSHGIKFFLYGIRLETEEEAKTRMNKELDRKQKNKVYRDRVKENKNNE